MADKMIDVSTWQGNINWNAVKSSGVKAAIIRAGFGSHMSQKDKKFDQNYTNAKAAGMPIGAYWYSYATSVSDAKSEAATCIEVLKGKQFEYPIYYDLEDPSMTKCGKTVLTQIAVAFCEALEAAGYFVGIYANPNWLKNFLNYGTVKKYTLWLAHWGVSEPGYPCDVWQYSSSGSVSGISGRVDLDWGYRDFATTIKDGGFNGFSKETTNSSTSNTTSSDGFKVGDIVKVNQGAKSYTGQPIASFVYNNTYPIDQISGDRAVLDEDGLCTAFNVKDLTKVGQTSTPSTSTPAPSTSGIKVGDTVRVNKGAKTYDGQSLASFVYDRDHKVSQVSGDRVVIGLGSAVTAAVKMSDLTKV